MADRVEWSSELATGIEDIDQQHKRLIELYNNFEEAADQNKGRRHLDALLDNLVTYTAEHFTFEESYLEEQGYPELESHRRTHRQLSRKLERLCIEHRVNRRRVTGEVRRFLASWLTQHILKHDMEYMPWVSGGRPAGETPAEPVGNP